MTYSLLSKYFHKDSNLKVNIKIVVIGVNYF